jgi:hypothetical protein
LYRGEVCSEAEAAECREEIADLTWACANCKKHPPDEISPWTWHLLELRRLQQGGYPFEADDLSLEEWEELGTINEIIAALEKENVAGLFKI